MSKYRYYHNEIQNDGSLHEMENEKDACGVGFVASVDGIASHKIVRLGLTSVCNVTHRGVVEPDGKTGDGAGISTSIPVKIFQSWMGEQGIELTDPTKFGVGVFFLPGDSEAEQLKCRVLVDGMINNRGLKVLGWRDVPVNPLELGEIARASMPKIVQVIIEQPADMDGDAFERALFIVRRKIEKRSVDEAIADFYCSSLSCRMISYKVLVVASGVEKFYLDLQRPDYEASICLYHQRFSTNTFPTWGLCQPFRMLAHNGEINTLRGNRNWLASRETDFKSEIWGDDIDALYQLLDDQESDSASLDRALEALVLSGRDITHAMAMLVPPAWRIDPTTPEEEKAFYQFHRCFSEPWDGPAALVFTDGKKVAASLDRNGLRPARFKLTTDGILTVGSEVGVVDLDDSKIKEKGRLAPGEMICLDTTTGEVLHNKEIKARLAARQPYKKWLEENREELSTHLKGTNFPAEPSEPLDILSLSQKQVAHGFNKEELDIALIPMYQNGIEATYSMGCDIPLSVLSTEPRLLFTYFKQLFAQVTNPPIDPIRERLVMTLGAGFGRERNWLSESAEHARVLNVDSPILFDEELAKIQSLDGEYEARTLDATFSAVDGVDGLETAVDRICAEAETAVEEGIQIIILSDRKMDHERVPIPAIMATGAVHHHLNRARKRMRCSLVTDTGEARDPHQIACLFGYGATAVCPHLGYATIREVLQKDKKGVFEGLGFVDLAKNYRQALEKGLLKIMSKMGISVLNSYQGAQIFEAVGIGAELIGKCFDGTHSKVSGIGFKEVAADSLTRHQEAYGAAVPDGEALKLGDPGYYRYRRNGERHAIANPILKNFHTFVKDNDPEKYEKYVEDIKASQPVSLHNLLELVPNSNGPVPIEEVEPIEDIRIRFTTAAMSLGAISPEAHETLAEAMNAIGGKSDSGEGGEDPIRFNSPKNSKIKQVASGRFGVSAEYLANCEEIEIKMAQGAKPGEGGQLPGHKVNGLIARLRRTQPGVQLISPPPHHDIYSIEDLAQLIHDLKEVNPRARICVKLVAETGVGTIAAGVAKANADIILISGHEGGTGASPLSSIKHAGLPWEIGLAETQQVLMLNDFRKRVTLRTDGGLRTGEDIIHAAILGAEEFNFGTIALIAMGCVYVRKCHLNTCPVGIASQDPKYRAKFKGTKENVINFFNAVSEEVRRIMATLGVRKLDELIGRPEYLRQRHVADHPKANMLDLSRILKDVAKEAGHDIARICTMNRNDGSHAHPLDDKILQQAQGAIKEKTPITLEYKIKNTNRNVGTKLSGSIAYIHGDHGLPDGTVNVMLRGSAGQSFGTFLCGGVKLDLTGEANDYVGKGMSGGQIIIRPPSNASFAAADNSIVGNTVMYGATGGELFAEGLAGERFCVRNSGGTGVVEGCGDHGCEYMTNGRAVILGATGKNFGAGMSGGVAYVYDIVGNFNLLFNPEMIKAEPVTDEAELKELAGLIHRHLELTGSVRAKEIMDDWATNQKTFLKVSPKDTPKPPPYEDVVNEGEVAAKA
ncbi:MAG: glutamate synthase domain-containing protein 2/glutamate synthase domain-containing protein 1 [Verrucomicrobiales bacterium]|jgi:glutamate synthase domain-containing protein 2/glutamate synthase domain-containing protein 1/glutamate synthase domain-containing protein 3